MFRIRQLFLYLIKSCAGTPMAALQLSEHRGVVNDRILMVVNEDGRYLSQRTAPRMAVIRPRCDGDDLIVEAPGLSSLRIPKPHVLRDGLLRDVRLREIPLKGLDYGDVVANWFSQATGHRCRLVGRPNDFQRQVPGSTAGLAYADAYPLLVVSAESLKALNDATGLPPVEMLNFRPTVVVEGCDAYAEDLWLEILAGDLRLIGETRCTRCSVISVDQTTGIRDPEQSLLSKLTELRPAPELKGKPVFGRNYRQAGRGTLVLGQSISAR